jgi:endonuclease/exonuclease/phosphatase family metal-dependent hydrolase
MQFLSVATYNVHEWIGRDGRQDRPRVAKVISELEAHIVGLQEVSYPTGEGRAQTLHDLFGESGMQIIAGPTLLRADGRYGNALLTSYPVRRVERIDLSMHAREPRGALDVDMVIEGVPVKVIVTHLGLKGSERGSQMEKLLGLISESTTPLVVVMGDFNVWFSRSSLIREIERIMGPIPAPRTYPARYPLLRLDRIWVRPSEALVKIRVHETPLARIASDHLPVKAVVDMDKAAHTETQ